MADRSDDELLTSGSSDDFALFYRRHARAVLAYFARRLRNSEAAADLTAETFAAAILARRRYRSGSAPAAAWLMGIAAHKLTDYHRRGEVEERARQRLGLTTPPLTYEDDEFIRAAAEQDASDLLAVLPEEQRDAVRARVLADEAYEDMARRTDISAPVLRQRVSRGLRTLRDRLESQG